MTSKHKDFFKKTILNCKSRITRSYQIIFQIVLSWGSKEMEQHKEHVNRAFCAIQMEAVKKFVEMKDLEEMERPEEHATRAKHALAMVPVE